MRDLTVFSFSTENWTRPDSEVGDLMGLFCELIDREVPELNAENVQMRFIGRLGELDADLPGAHRLRPRPRRPGTPVCASSSR